MRRLSSIDLRLEMDSQNKYPLTGQRRLDTRVAPSQVLDFANKEPDFGVKETYS